jgi:2-amino-4-hydroxy-6-hydroxymethyldihydropteridine diphosphokinase
MTQDTWTPAYIGIGSNLDNPQAQVARGFAALERLPRTLLIARSRLYRTTPVGPADQPEYINAVAGLLTQLDAPALLMELKALEKQLGRSEPVVRWGPRVIDFDLLALGSTRSDTNELKLPHPGIAERAFVLFPLNDVAPQVDIPGVGRPWALLEKVDASGVEAL